MATVLPVILSTVVALVVPAMAFWFALRQERTRWLRAERTQLYADLLVEAHAESEWLEYEMAHAQHGIPRLTSDDDLRLPRKERAQLAARANALGSQNVGRLFNDLERHAFWAPRDGDPMREAERIMTRVRVNDTLEELREAIRRDLGTDRGHRRRFRSIVFGLRRRISRGHLGRRQPAA